MELHLRVLKEPRGFIRVVQFVLSIFAFATTAGYTGSTAFQFPCNPAAATSTPLVQNVVINFGYPFKSFISTEPVDYCDKEKPKPFGLACNFSSSAEFFVTTGVLAFLYSAIITAFYIFMNQMYTNNQLVPIVDLAVTGVLALFWIAGSSAWSQGVSDVKYFTDPKFVMKKFGKCEGNCNISDVPNFATLNVSLIFGFANFLLWVASMWFVYKETIFHLQRQQQQQAMPPQGQQVQIPPQTTQSPQSPQGYKY